PVGEAHALQAPRLKPSSWAASRTLPNRSRLWKNSAFSDSEYLRKARLAPGPDDGPGSSLKGAFFLKEELLIDGVSMCVAIPVHRGVATITRTRRALTYTGYVRSRARRMGGVLPTRRGLGPAETPDDLTKMTTS